MGKKRGFFAELQHQSAMAEKQRHREQAAAAQQQIRRQREAERARAAASRARLQAGRADAKAQAAAEREAKRLHVAAMEAEVEALNGELEQRLEEIDKVLSATLDVDDFVDLESLRRDVTHPPFQSKYEAPTPAPEPIVAPREPVFTPPEAPKGLSAMLGGKKKHEVAVAKAQAEFESTHSSWRAVVGEIPAKQLEQLTARKKAETERLERLSKERGAYDTQCREREADVDRQNAELDELIRGFERGDRDAVDQYIGIVLGNSVYPEGIEIDTDHSFDASSREVTVSIFMPRPDELPTARQFKYVKAKDEIAETSQTSRELKDRYGALVNNVALRTLHEIWESDRDGKIRSISLVAGVHHVDPALGVDTMSPLLAVAVEREAFLEIDLSRATPAESLRHLKATVSKDPRGLVPIDSTLGVKG